MKHLLTVFSVYVILQAANGADTDSLYVRIIDDSMEYNNQSSVIRTIPARSPVECGVECDKVPACVSFNVKKEPDNIYVCVLLDSIPLSPTRDLTLAKDTEYYEKTCQPRVRVRGTTNLGSSMRAVYVFGDMGTSGYLLKFRPNFDQESFNFHQSIDSMTSGRHKILSGVEDMHTSVSIKKEAIVSEGRLFCNHFTIFGTPPVCFPSLDSVPLKDIFNTEEVNAIMSDAVGQFIYGFTQDQVIKVNAPDNANWTVDSVLDLPGVPGSQFQHFPRGIRGATLMRNHDTTVAFTAFYYMVIDNANTVIKRSQVCL